ncbi:hypothetical protein DVO94_21460, partial [Yersinia enterocolitica]|nr:hypothetical protein [Yersinia enterocolitica]
GSRRAILGADALLFYPSSPYNIASSRFVSSLTHDLLLSFLRVILIGLTRFPRPPLMPGL